MFIFLYIDFELNANINKNISGINTRPTIKAFDFPNDLPKLIENKIDIIPRAILNPKYKIERQVDNGVIKHKQCSEFENV